MTHGAQAVDPNTNEVKDFHSIGQDSSTPIAGVLNITSITVATPPKVVPKTAPKASLP